MANVGSFGAAKKEAERAITREPDTFTYFGEEIRISDEIGMAPLMDFASAAAEGADSTDMSGLAAIKEMLKDSVHPDDWPRFWQLTKANKVQPDLLLEIVRVVMESVTGRPTDSPSDSSYGQSVSSESLNASSPQPVSLPVAAATVPVG